MLNRVSDGNVSGEDSLQKRWFNESLLPALSDSDGRIQTNGIGAPTEEQSVPPIPFVMCPSVMCPSVMCQLA